MDANKLAQELDFDLDTVLRLLSTFADTSEKNLAELEASIAAGDGPKTASLAHHIKGAAASLELSELRAAAAAVETAARAGSTAGLEGDLARIRSGIAAVRAALER